MELMAYLENSSNLTLTSYNDLVQDTANADSTNYSTRYPSVKGDPVGILVASGSLTPLQATGTGIDIATSTVLYSAYIAPSVTVTGSGSAFTTALSATTTALRKGTFTSNLTIASERCRYGRASSVTTTATNRHRGSKRTK